MPHLPVNEIFPPPPAVSFAAGGAGLLDRLRQWPAGERRIDDRADEVSRWLAAVKKRAQAGEPRRVFFVHGQLPGETGSGVYLQQIAREMLRQGVDFHILCAGYETLGSAHFPGVPRERIATCRFTHEGETPEPGSVKTPISGMSVGMPYPVLAFRDRTEEQLCDWLQVFGARIAEGVARLQPDVIHVNHLWFLNALARLVAPWIPLVASAHGTAYKLIVDAPRFRDLVVPCVSSADHVLAISPESVRECVNMFRIPPERISIEGYGFEPDLFHYRPVNGAGVVQEVLGIDLPSGSRIALAVGKFVDWKGFREFAVAVGRLRERGVPVIGIVVGEGSAENRAELEAFLDEKGLAAVFHLPGKVPRETLPDIYRAADVYVLPSHVEPFGMVLMEAMACGAPAVAARTGGPPHFVPGELLDRGLAVLVDPVVFGPDGSISPEARAGYAENLANAMASLLEQAIDETQRRRIAGAVGHLRWDKLIGSLLGIYDRVLGKALDRFEK